MSDDFIENHIDSLEDFWRRKEAAPRYKLLYPAFGVPVEFRTNDPSVLAAARLSEERFSRSSILSATEPLSLDFILDPQLPEADIPLDWPARLRYQGTGDWLTIQAEPWVNACVNLESRQGLALISRSLAAHPSLYSRYIADSFTLNLLLRSGLGQLHASCVSQDGRAVLLSARNNTGKSTSALRLALNGYRLLSDGMTYVRMGAGPVELLGYPAGEIKLRLDTIGQFPFLAEAGTEVRVREDRKMVYNLRRLLPGSVLEDSIFPERIVVCLIERTGRETTRAEPLGRQAALVELFPEIAHFDEPRFLFPNLEAIRALLERSDCYRLRMGTDEAGILKAIEEL